MDKDFNMYAILNNNKQIYLTKFKNKDIVSIAIKGFIDNNNEELIIQELEELQQIIQKSINQLKQGKTNV